MSEIPTVLVTLRLELGLAPIEYSFCVVGENVWPNGEAYDAPPFSEVHEVLDLMQQQLATHLVKLGYWS